MSVEGWLAFADDVSSHEPVYLNRREMKASRKQEAPTWRRRCMKRAARSGLRSLMCDLDLLECVWKESALGGCPRMDLEADSFLDMYLEAGAGFTVFGFF